MSLLFKMQDVLFSRVDNDILVLNLSSFLSPLNVQFLDVLALLIKLDVFVSDES